jgi:hypothetical protein
MIGPGGLLLVVLPTYLLSQFQFSGFRVAKKTLSLYNLDVKIIFLQGHILSIVGDALKMHPFCSLLQIKISTQMREKKKFKMNKSLV